MKDISGADELFLDAVDHIVLQAVDAIGDDQQARFAFFRRLATLAREVAEEKRRASCT